MLGCLGCLQDIDGHRQDFNLQRIRLTMLRDQKLKQRQEMFVSRLDTATTDTHASSFDPNNAIYARDLANEADNHSDTSTVNSRFSALSISSISSTRLGSRFVVFIFLIERVSCLVTAPEPPEARGKWREKRTAARREVNSSPSIWRKP